MNSEPDILDEDTSQSNDNPEDIINKQTRGAKYEIEEEYADEQDEAVEETVRDIVDNV